MREIDGTAHTKKKLIAKSFLFLMGCVGIPENVIPVDNFGIEKS